MTSDNLDKKPVIRFKGFTDDWEQRKFSEVLEFSVPNNTLSRADLNYKIGVIKNIHYGDILVKFDSIVDINNSNVPFITDGKIEKFKNYLLQNGDVIIADTAEDETTGKTIEITGITNNFAVSGLHTMVARPNIEFAPKFLGYYLNCKSYRHQLLKLMQGIKVLSLSKNNIAKTNVIFPKKVLEQQKIGMLFDNIDNTIALHQRKLDKTQDLKKTMLTKMFPKYGEKKSELKSMGFTDDWEQRKLEDLVTQVIREVPKPIKPYWRMSVRSHAKGTFRQFVEDPSKVAMDKLFLVEKDDLVVNITFAWEHAIAVVPEENAGLLVSHRFPTYRADGKSDISFLYYLISQEDFRKKLDLISPGGAGRNRVLNKKAFLELKVYVPSTIEEQIEIGNFFSKLDKTITLHQRELNQLKNIKKILLKYMFV